MDRMSGPMGRLLAALPLEQRAERYRQFAAAAVTKAQESTDPDRKTEYLTMAAGWHSLAVEAEHSLGIAIPSVIFDLEDGGEEADALP